MTQRMKQSTWMSTFDLEPAFRMEKRGFIIASKLGLCVLYYVQEPELPL
jgi:hypothetical protein